MCGITGQCTFNGDTIDVKKFLDSTNLIRHRGPDDEGYLLYNMADDDLVLCKGADSDERLDLPEISTCYHRAYSLAFGFRRLSILDLSISGHQPMPSPDRMYWIVFNGEIYNYVELRAELKKAGYQFQSTSDTEVLLAGYRQWGTALLNKLIGMFAFVILDIPNRKLFLARDFFGIKPLYYVLDDKRFAFASEAKALLNLDSVGREVNPQAVYSYLRHGLTDHDESSLWRDIQKLPPAHYLEIPLDGSSIKPPHHYWQIDASIHSTCTKFEAAEQLRSMFLDSIRLHLRSDVPVGAALSGGIDSSSIVITMRQLQGNDLDLHAFSYLADDPIWNEEKWVDMAGVASKATVHKVIFSAGNLLEDLDQLIYAQDEPFGSTSIYAQYCVFRLAKQHNIKVMLDGQGADEMLGGYAYYLSARLLSLMARGAWSTAYRFVESVWDRPDSGGIRILLRTAAMAIPEGYRRRAFPVTGANLTPRWFNSSWLRDHQIEPKSMIPQINKHEALRDMLLHTFTKTSLPMLLRYEDHNSMAHSVESRVPFLTPQIVNFIFTLPEQYLIDKEGVSKSIFREAMRQIVPDKILDRRDKIGFNTPEKNILTALKPWITDILNSATAINIPALDILQVKKSYVQMNRDDKKFNSNIWRWINLIRWAEIHKARF